MKTVLHVIDTTGPGGAENVFINLADKLRDHECRSIALIRGKGWVFEELQRRQIETHIIDCKGSFNFRFLLDLIRLIKSEKVDVIQSHLLGSNIYCAMAGLITGKPVFATFHGGVDVAKNERFLALKCRILNWGVAQFIAVSEGLRKEIEATGLLSSDKTTVIYNGVDPDRYFKRDSHKIRSKINVNEDAILVGSLGNVRPAKAYDVLIEAAALAVKLNPNLHFVIAGDNTKEPLMSELLSLVKEKALEQHIHFIGYQDNGAEFLGQMDIFLLTSSSEGFSIATIEALATGLPVIATKCGGPEEILSHETTARLVPKNDPKAIACTLTDVTLSNVKSETLRYSLDSTVENYLEIYTKCLH